MILIYKNKKNICKKSIQIKKTFNIYYKREEKGIYCQIIVSFTRTFLLSTFALQPNAKVL